ncbi:hypothetical protein [Streptomyces sp. NPDC004546]|uniref:hypothetical protein n=1 Tax=unclassified Streptomyces TaxID=2593676 RepID=UPI0033BBADC3
MHAGLTGGAGDCLAPVLVDAAKFEVEDRRKRQITVAMMPAFAVVIALPAGIST